MRPPLAVTVLALAVSSAPGPAQSLQPTATAPIALSINSGGTTLFSSTVPSGGLPAAGSTTIGQPGTEAQFGWFATQANTGMTFSMNFIPTLSSPSAGASLQGSGILLALSAPFASPAMLELVGENFAYVGASPAFAIDVGDDGFPEVTELIPATSIPVVLGPVPTLVRVRITATQVGSGSTTLWLRCYPDNGSDVQIWNVGCESVPVGVQARFDGNFELGAFPMQGQPTIGVLSLGLQSVLLGTSFGVPCILLPAPDVVLAFPSTATTTIVVPPAVRPLFFFTQGVALSLNGLATGAAFAARAL